MFRNAEWISPEDPSGCPEFLRKLTFTQLPVSAVLTATSIGVYDVRCGGKPVSDRMLAPGCTVYEKRLQYQTWDLTPFLEKTMYLSVTVAPGWHRGRISSCPGLQKTPPALLAVLTLTYADGRTEEIESDGQWQCRKSQVISSDLYDGEEHNYAAPPALPEAVQIVQLPKEQLIPDEGECVRPRERLKPCRLLHTPKGERVLDFGQNLAGILECTVDVPEGTVLQWSCGEILDENGNFYNGNYRTAKAQFRAVCAAGKQTIRPRFCFYGFRYIRLDEWPETVDPDDFTAAAVYSDLKRTGHFSCGSPLLNRLYSNVLWSMRSNFIDLPTDCPQRDERIGWTGDAQVFCRTACNLYDVRRFFSKWMHDVCAEQLENGEIRNMVPDFWQQALSSAVWGDAITIIPWQIWLHYADRQILADCLPAMKKWLAFIAADTRDPDLWTGCGQLNRFGWPKHFGDWLALDGHDGKTGASDKDFIGSAYYYGSAILTRDACRALGEDAGAYEALAQRIRKAFLRRFRVCHTQTEYVLALYFGLTDSPEQLAADLAARISEDGGHLTTGFAGTQYLLHALSDNGQAEAAWDLLLREDYPSWLYEVRMGATTIWEHWDGILPDGTLCSPEMNSYNHYSSGSVFDWVLEKAAGIQPAEPGYRKVRIAPLPDARPGWLEASLDTDYGTVSSGWTAEGDIFRYEISTPVPGTVCIAGRTFDVVPGSYTFYSVIPENKDKKGEKT